MGRREAGLSVLAESYTAVQLKDGYGSDDTRQRYCGKCQGGNRDRHNGGREKRAMGGSGKESAWSPDLKKKWSGHGSVCL